MIVGLDIEIQTQNLPSKKQECHPPTYAVCGLKELNPHGRQLSEKYRKLDRNMGFAEATI
jgi:hypothetical protein